MKGFGLISLLITVAIIGLLVFGGFYFNNGQKKNQIQLQQDSIQDAKDAAAAQDEYNATLQTELQNFDSGGDNVNYRSIQQKLK